MRSKDSMKTHVVFITAGEWPAQKGLLVSQVLETARAFHAKGNTVSWLAAIPLLSRLKRWVLRDHDLHWLEVECKKIGMLFEYKIIPVTLGSPWSMLLRSWWHERLACHALHHLVSGVGAARATVLHARSYDAADIGLRLRRLMHSQNPSCPVVASFDMRSILGPEIPMGHGAVGTAAYGFVKALEFELIRDSDVSFLGVDIVRRQYLEETGLTIQYAPIQGLERQCLWSVDFEARWASRRIGYSGSVGQWNDPVLLRQIFDLFPLWRPQLASEMINAFEGLDCKFYQQSELQGYYEGLLALVIPGLAQVEGYYRTLKMRCNFFSTKAAEALSMGVPLIVSSELQELADFVREHECGIVVDVINGQPVLPQLPDIDSRELWERLTGNAARVGERFARSAVLGVYERAWEAALARRQGEQL